MEQAKKQVLSRQPTNQFVTVEQVAALAAFLASEAAASITGANYTDRRRLDRAIGGARRSARIQRYFVTGLRAVSNGGASWQGTVAPQQRRR